MSDTSDEVTKSERHGSRKRPMWVIVLILVVVGLGIGLLSITVASWRRPEGLGRTPEGTLRPCPETPNCVCSEFPDSEAAVDPIEFQGDPEQAWKTWLLTVASHPGGSLVIGSDRYMHAEFITPWLRFVDDFECRLDPESNRIHVRSASRVGRSDLGVNRRRIEELRQAFLRRRSGEVD